ncbi:MAG: ABC transporter ATP-binding protein [Eubacteriaceae bacterium]|nr:ABC transporter ATP-binding protein [Eubacteriaceae bacterium]
MPIIDVRNLSFVYPNKNKILNDISFTLKKGEMLCVLGPNGCGKTTMIQCILGMNKVEKGEIFIEGENISDISMTEMAKKISYIPQKQKHTFDYTVLEIVLMGRTAHISMFDSPRKMDIEISMDCLKKVGMEKFMNRNFNSLSGGESQLVKFARALAQEADLMIFDEPTSHLDFYHELSIIKHMTKLIKESKISIVMATHFPNHAFFFESQGIPTNVAIMDKGIFGAYGSACETLNEKNMEHIFRMKTKVYDNLENDRLLRYMIPLDFK